MYVIKYKANKGIVCLFVFCYVGRPYNMEWWNGRMTEWQKISPNPKITLCYRVAHYVRTLNNKLLLERIGLLILDQQYAPLHFGAI